MTEPIEFEAFMRAYQNMVYTVAVRLLGCEADAQDVAQEVFLKAYERFAELSKSPTAGGWLKTVTRNLCLNHLTRYRSRWRFFSEMFSGDKDEDSAMEMAGPDTAREEQENQERHQVLERALGTLPESQRVPLVLYHFEEMSYEEIAAQLGVSLSKIKTDIFRGRETLRRRLRWDVGGEVHPIRNSGVEDGLARGRLGDSHSPAPLI